MTDWNGYASTAIVVTAAQPPPAAVLSFAIVQGAVYDAVNAIDRGHRAYLPQPPARPSDSKDAAAATAAYSLLVGLFPAQQPTLQPLYEASLAGVADTPAGAKAGGIAAGTAAAAAMLAARKDDGRFSPFTPVIGTTPGTWRPTPPAFAQDPAPWVGNVRPFVVPNVEMLRTQPPNALTSRAYSRDFNEIKDVGSLHSTTRTAGRDFCRDLLAGPRLRALEPHVPHPRRRAGIWASSTTRGLFATANLAAADAAIGCWNNKYYWNTWRPITAIREAASDGNRATIADPSWTPLFDPSTPVAAPPALVTPPFPEYPSGHNCAAGAIVRTLRDFFHTDRVAFSVSSNKTATTRSFRSLSDALKENINARVWAGIHFRTADVAGAALGKKVARYLHRHYLQPVRSPDCDPSVSSRNQRRLGE